MPGDGHYSSPAATAAAGFPREGIIERCQETDAVTTMKPMHALCAAIAFASLSGCELLKKNEEVASTINGRAVGMPAGAFFDRFGRPGAKREQDDGSAEYVWTSSVPFAKSGPDGLDERICKLRVSVDIKGRVSGVQILVDAQGLKSTSRCAEIFGAA